MRVQLAVTVAVMSASAAAHAAPKLSGATSCVAPAANERAIDFDGAALVPICHEVYVEPAVTADERARLAGDFGRALHDLGARLGELEAELPATIFCKTDACRVYFAGTARRSYVLSSGERLPGASYRAPRQTVVIVVVDPSAKAVLVHELVHVEVTARLAGVHVPAWFHEGVATSIADAPTCAAGLERGVDDLRRLDTHRAWLDYTNDPYTIQRTYCQARTEVEAWSRKDLRRRLLALIDAVRHGASFDATYGALVTQPSAGTVPTIVLSPATELGDRGRPFTLALWVKPNATTGVLAHVSATEIGTGWCMPFLGYAASGHLVAQVLHGTGPDPSQFAIVTDPATHPPGAWLHVAMTWSASTGVRLYVDGALVAHAAAPVYNASGTPMYVAWGSRNAGGTACWSGAIDGGTFAGETTEPKSFDHALAAADIAALAAKRP